MAAENGHLEVIEALIKADADVNASNKNGTTALQVAAINGHLKVVEALIEAGADVNASNNNGVTALQVAAENGHLEVIEALIKAGAKVDQENTNGDTALKYAADHGHVKIVKALIKAGADINKSGGENKETALKYAAQKGHTEVVEALIEAGADVNVSNKIGATALQGAAKNGRLKVVEVLIAARADLAKENKAGLTALSLAAELGHLKVVEALIKAGADVNKSGDKDEETALKYASTYGHTEVVEALIKASADVNVSNKNGATALQAAAENGRLKIVKALIAAGAIVDKENTNGVTALKYAAYYGHVKIVKALIKAGADVNKSGGENEETALKYAAQKGHTEVVKLLIKAKVNVSAGNKDGSTALQVAAENGHLEIVKVLVEAGAEIDHKNKFGFDAQHFASEKGHTEVVKFLTKTEHLIHDEVKAIETSCPVNNRYDQFPAKESPKPAEPAQLAQNIQPLQSEESAEIYHALALTATSLAMLGGVGALLLPQVRQPAVQPQEQPVAQQQEQPVAQPQEQPVVQQQEQPVAQNRDEEEMILKASYALDPINLYLNKISFFTLEEIKPLEWKIEDNKFVLELEHQPEDLKEGILDLFDKHGNFSDYLEPITGNENKRIITFTPLFTKMVKDSNNYTPNDLGFTALQSIKDQLELLCARKNQEFEENYGEFFRGLDFIGERKVISIFNKHFIHAEDFNFKELMHFNLLNNFGLLILDDSLKNQLSISENGKISHHEDFYGEDDNLEIVEKYNKRTEESESEGLRDSIYNGVRIGERFFDRTDPIDGENKIKYFVRFPEKPSDFALACTTTNRRIEFFEAKTDDLFEIQALTPINREDAVILFNSIREAGQDPAPVIQNGAQLNQVQVQGQGQAQGQGHN